MRDQRSFSNRLLSRLAADDLALLVPHLETVAVPRGGVLVEPNAPIPFVYFPESGIASLIIRSPAGHQAEVGLIGREGFIHPAAVLGSDRIPYRVEVQIPGGMHRLPFRSFLRAVDASASLRQIALLFAEALAVQGARTSLSYAVHGVDERLARWLLMCHDRCDGDEIHITHEFLSIMLAVRRPSVTNALHVLEGERMIRSERSVVTIRDRPALEAFAADAYGEAEASYSRLLGEG